MKRAGVLASEVDACYMGNVLSAGLGQAPARQAALGAGLSARCVCTTVNKVCASGLKAVTLAVSEIAIGSVDVVVAGGMECMSMVPHYVPGARFGMRIGDRVLIDGVSHDGLIDPYDGHHMGMCAEACARTHKISREAQDAFARRSYTRALQAWDEHLFDAEIEPVVTTVGRKEVIIERDEECFRIERDLLTSMRPAFLKDGTGSVTSGNASGLNDGAAAVVLMSSKKAKQLNIQPLARVIAFADAATKPAEFTTAPSIVIPKVLNRAGLTLEDVDALEINEAFSVVVEANMKLLGLSSEKVNPWGGAVALGHPIGCSGARILVTLLNVMHHEHLTRGIATICNGGGGATAIVIEREAHPQSNL